MSPRRIAVLGASDNGPYNTVYPKPKPKLNAKSPSPRQILYCISSRTSSRAFLSGFFRQLRAKAVRSPQTLVLGPLQQLLFVSKALAFLNRCWLFSLASHSSVRCFPKIISFLYAFLYMYVCVYLYLFP